MAKRLVNIQAEDDFIKKAKEFAANNYMSLTALIKIAVIEYIENHTKK